MMTIDTWLKDSTATLNQAGIETARLDSMVLLEDDTGRDRGWLLAHPEHELSQSQAKKLDILLARRIQHEPLAYIRGKAEFYGYEFIVTPDVLVPRPESEALIDLLQAYLESDPSVNSVVDIGTGSGCLAITAQRLFPSLGVYATDTQSTALSIARRNAKKHHAAVQFYRGDLLDPLAEVPTNLLYGIITNLPYVALDHPVNRAASHEPSVALFAEEQGLRLYRQLFERTTRASLPPGFVITESFPAQHTQMTDFAKKAGFRLKHTKDFAQLFVRI